MRLRWRLARWLGSSFVPPITKPVRAGEVLRARRARVGGPAHARATPRTTSACTTRPTACSCRATTCCRSITPHISGPHALEGPARHFLRLARPGGRDPRREAGAARARPPVHRPRRPLPGDQAAPLRPARHGEAHRPRARPRRPCRRSRSSCSSRAAGARWRRARPTRTSSTCASRAQAGRTSRRRGLPDLRDSAAGDLIPSRTRTPCSRASTTTRSTRRPSRSRIARPPTRTRTTATGSTASIATARFYFGAALGLYPHQQVMDAHFSILRGRRAARAARLAARAARAERDAGRARSRSRSWSRCGGCASPSRANETGVEAELDVRLARAGARRSARAHEGRPDHAQPDRHDALHAVRHLVGLGPRGRPRDEASTASRTYATRDRSWGVRPVGAAAPGRPGDAAAGRRGCGRRSTSRTSAFLLGYFQRPDGERWNADGMRVPVSASPEPVADPDAPGFVHLEPLGERARLPAGHALDRARGVRRAAARRREAHARARDRAALQHERPRLRASALGPRRLARRARRRGRAAGRRATSSRATRSTSTSTTWCARRIGAEARRRPARADPARAARALRLHAASEARPDASAA